MILIDANLLIYAYDSSCPQHEVARLWLEDILSGPDPVRLPLMSLLAFLRITTHGRILENPFTTEEALEIVDEWLALDQVTMVGPGPRHFEILRHMADLGQAYGPLLMDAHLAALATEHGLVLCSHDRDFARFDTLRWIDPMRPAESVHER